MCDVPRFEIPIHRRKRWTLNQAVAIMHARSRAEKAVLKRIFSDNSFAIKMLVRALYSPVLGGVRKRHLRPEPLDPSITEVKFTKADRFWLSRKVLPHGKRGRVGR